MVEGQSRRPQTQSAADDVAVLLARVLVVRQEAGQDVLELVLEVAEVYLLHQRFGELRRANLLHNLFEAWRALELILAAFLRACALVLDCARSARNLL